MRELPSYISRRIHDRDPLADVVWDENIHCWVLYWNKVRICPLFHEDGTDMHEVCVDEVLDIMGRYDNYNDGPERLESIRKTAARAQYRAQQRKNELMEESIKETENVTRTMLSGVSPQVHVENNPLYKEKVSC